MNKHYFERIQIDQDVINSFITRHTKMKEFFNIDEQFFIRISVKVFPGLLHAIISQNETNENVIKITSEFNTVLNSKITEKEVLKLSDKKLEEILMNKDKANLVKQICLDVMSKKLNLKKLADLRSDEIIERLLKYPYISKSTIKEFLIFTCGKKDIFWIENYDFILGLLKFTKIKEWTEQLINNIKNEYKNEETLFSICMIRLRYMQGVNHEK